MAKNIVFCADGTWNGPGRSATRRGPRTASNVFNAVPETRRRRCRGYDSGSPIRARTLSDSLGADRAGREIPARCRRFREFHCQVAGGRVRRRADRPDRARLYLHLAQLPARRSHLSLSGFSRGAYTARALAGLISAKGLLPPGLADPNDKDASYRAGSAVWYDWRRQTLIGSPSLVRLQEIVFDLPHFLQHPPDAATMVPAPIEAVAVRDTVGALGDFRVHRSFRCC